MVLALDLKCKCLRFDSWHGIMSFGKALIWHLSLHTLYSGEKWGPGTAGSDDQSLDLLSHYCIGKWVIFSLCPDQMSFGGTYMYLSMYQASFRKYFKTVSIHTLYTTIASQASLLSPDNIMLLCLLIRFIFTCASIG